MDKDVTATIQHLSAGERVALMRFMDLIPDEETDESADASPARRPADGAGAES